MLCDEGILTWRCVTLCLLFYFFFFTPYVCGLVSHFYDSVRNHLLVTIILCYVSDDHHHLVQFHIIFFFKTHHFSSPLKEFSLLNVLLSTSQSVHFKHRFTFILTPHLHFDFELPLTFNFIAVSSSSSLQIVLRYQDF